MAEEEEICQQESSVIEESDINLIVLEVEEEEAYPRVQMITPTTDATPSSSVMEQSMQSNIVLAGSLIEDEQEKGRRSGNRQLISFEDDVNDRIEEEVIDELEEEAIEDSEEENIEEMGEEAIDEGGEEENVDETELRALYARSSKFSTQYGSSGPTSSPHTSD